MNKSRLFFPLLMLLVMMAMCPMNIWAVSGSGSSTSPYLISADADYTWLRTEAAKTNNGTTAKYVKFVNDFNYSSDASKGGNKNHNLIFKSGKWILDLNSKTIATYRAHVIEISGADVTINDNSTDKKSKVYLIGEGFAICYNSGKLLVNDGNICHGGGMYPAALYSSSSLKDGQITLLGGTFEGIYMGTNFSNFKHICPDGYVLVNGNGDVTGPPDENFNTPAYISSTVTAVKFEINEKNAASSVTVGETTNYYLSLDDAVDAAKSASEPATIKLYKDTSIGNRAGQSCFYFDTGNITLDLNGKTISYPSGVAVIGINGCELTIKDSSSEKSGKITGGQSTLQFNDGKLVVEGGSYSGSHQALRIDSLVQNAVKLHGGSFNAINVLISINWNTIDMRGYHLEDAEGNNVAIPKSDSKIKTAVHVVSGYESPTKVTAGNYESLGLSSDYIGYYAIRNENQLLWLSDSLDKKAVLIADIDLSSICHVADSYHMLSEVNWTPIGNYNSKKPFTGVLDGNGHSISGMYNNYIVGYQGLFGYIENATLMNFKVSGSIVSSHPSHSDIGGVAGRAMNSTIHNVVSDVNITIGESLKHTNIGGIVGYCYGSVISSDTYIGQLDAGASTIGVAGIAGYAIKGSEIKNCLNAGAITTRGKGDIAGIVGLVLDKNFKGVSNCLNAGSLTAPAGAYKGAVYGRFGSSVNNSSYVGSNNYYLSSSADNAVGKSYNDTDPASVCTSVSAGQLRVGEVCYWLNGKTSDGDLVWYQTIGSDATPVLENSGSNTVYYGYLCTALTYANKPLADESYAHIIGDKVEAKDATCLEDGNLDYWTCSACGKLFCDAEGAEETTLEAVTIPAGHKWSDDSHTHCTACQNYWLYYTATEDTESKIVPFIADHLAGYEDANNTFDSETKQGVIRFASKLTKVGGAAFQNCTGLTSVTLPTGVASVGDFVFWGCSALQSVSLPGSVKSIGYKTFYSCTSLSSITLPSSVSSIGENAFLDCSALGSMQFNSIPKVESGAFEGVKADCTYTLALNDGSYVYSGSNDIFPKVASVAYRRTQKSQWGTLVVPFAVTIDDDADYDYYAITDQTCNELTLTRLVGDVAAGKPAFIRMKESAKNAETGMYELAMEAAGASVSTTINNPDPVGDLTLTGTFSMDDVANCYIVANNALWNADSLKADDSLEDLEDLEGLEDLESLENLENLENLKSLWKDSEGGVIPQDKRHVYCLPFHAYLAGEMIDGESPRQIALVVTGGYSFTTADVRSVADILLGRSEGADISRYEIDGKEGFNIADMAFVIKCLNKGYVVKAVTPGSAPVAGNANATFGIVGE